MSEGAKIICCDCLDWLRQHPDDSVDLVMCSPPYEDARTYGIDFALKGQDWVDWAVERFVECVRVSKGLVAWVIEGKTKNYRWSATPALFMADLHRRGVGLRKPPIFHRVGIPGSGGPDWLRNDYEFIVCASKGKLPWSDNTAMGHPPKWAPGGVMANRLSNGTRVNQWGPVGSVNGGGKRFTSNKASRPSHVETKVRRKPDGTRPRDGVYKMPTLANPGNVIKCIVGGGVMGSDLANENEAPYPEKLAEFFIRSFCQPNGTVLDPFSGSGTTGAVAIRTGRQYIGLDIRQSQVDLTNRRLAQQQRDLIP